ncbi:MAG: hypothetical protein LZF62_300127 [Nitrospira sp.]|nr:MAG: hypothetical protein LZF62_300127 [Nitrospira sp.]
MNYSMIGVLVVEVGGESQTGFVFAGKLSRTSSASPAERSQR